MVFEWDMKPYQLFPCNHKVELEIEEEKIRQKLNADLNMNSCYGHDKKENDKKYYQQNKERYNEYDKIYRQQNKEQISKQRKEHYQQNKEQISNQKKEYYQQNNEQISKYKKKWRQQNKERINGKITCECGCVVNSSCLPRHRKTNKHKLLLESQL
tara:strand:+ start:45 stop:512 length:468 start_codon:yes stop_codon:yes gene_type:complete